MGNALTWPFGQSDSSNSDGGAAQGLTDIGKQIQQQTAMTPQATQQLNNSYTIGQDLQSLYSQQLGGANPEAQYQNQGPLAQQIYAQGLQQATNPTAGWQSTLAPQLKQAQDQINEYYNQRGLLDSGIAIGKMGEAGVDLAIQNAQNEMTYQQQSLSNAGTLSSNISNLNKQNVTGLQNLYGSQQGIGVNQQQLANQGYIAGAEYQAYPQQAQLGSYYGGQAAQQALPGQLIGAGGQLGAAFLGGF